MIVKKIDMHVHCSHIRDLPSPLGTFLPTPEELRTIYDAVGIEKGVVMPGGASPECAMGTVSTREVRQMVEQYADTVGWWFCPVDPRNIMNGLAADFSYMLAYYKEQGARGVSEMTANLPLDDSRFLNLFAHCEKQHMPVTLHFGAAGRGYGVVDELHLPRLERVLQLYPDLILIGHSPIWWNEIGDDVTEENREGYLTGPIRAEGRAAQLLRRYPNLHCDLSAMSAYSALMRDVNYTYSFLAEFTDQIYFATDIISPQALDTPQMKLSAFLDDAVAGGHISQIVYEKICRRNALTLLDSAGA